MLKSQESKNKHLLDKSVEYLINRICNTIDNKYNCNVYCSWFTGALCLATSLLTETECIKTLWGKGNDYKAKELLKSCLLPMISIWFRYDAPLKKIPEDVLSEGKKNAIYNTLTLMNVYTERDAIDFINMDRQYNYEKDLAEERGESDDAGISNWFSILILAKLRGSLDTQITIDWEHQHYPIKQSTDLCFIHNSSLTDITGSGNPGITDVLALTCVLIPNAGCVMVDFFDKVNN